MSTMHSLLATIPASADHCCCCDCSMDSLIAAAGGCVISLGATYCGGKVAQLLNFGLREHEEAQRAGDGTIGLVAAVVCVVLVAVSAEASSGRPTRSRLLFGIHSSIASMHASLFHLVLFYGCTCRH